MTGLPAAVSAADFSFGDVTLNESVAASSNGAESHGHALDGQHGVESGRVQEPEPRAAPEDGQLGPRNGRLHLRRGEATRPSEQVDGRSSGEETRGSMNRGELVSRERRAIWLLILLLLFAVALGLGLWIANGAAGPPTPVISPIGLPKDVTSQRSAHFRFSAARPVTFECALDAQPFTTCGANVVGSKSYPGPLPLGQHTFKVRSGARAQNEPRGHVLVVHRPLVRADAVSGVRSAVGTVRRRPVLERQRRELLAAVRRLRAARARVAGARAAGHRVAVRRAAGPRQAGPRPAAAAAATSASSASSSSERAGRHAVPDLRKRRAGSCRERRR